MNARPRLFRRQVADALNNIRILTQDARYRWTWTPDRGRYAKSGPPDDDLDQLRLLVDRMTRAQQQAGIVRTAALLRIKAIEEGRL